MNTNTWITFIAVAVLLFAGIYLLRDGDTVPTDTEQPTFVEVIDGEEVALDYPLVESFSNASSNNSLAQNTTNAETAGENTSVTSANVITTITKPFLLGFYYFENIQKKGLENCIGREISEESDPIEFPEYNEDNFRLTEIQIQNKSAYLHVDADQSPNGLCAYITQYKNIGTHLFDAIHIVVN